jgi:hypothetical protein
MKLEWTRKANTVCCTRNERSGSAWFKTGTWKLRGMRRVFEKRRCFREEEDYITKIFGNKEAKGTIF